MRLVQGVAVSIAICAIGLLIWIVSAEWRATYARHNEVERILARPDVQDLLSQGNALCPDQTERFYWICGTTLRFDSPPPSGRCSTQDTPRYIGDMGYPYLRWSMALRAELPLTSLRPCSEQGKCVTLSALDAGFAPQRPPASLPSKPRWPDFDATETYGPWAPGVWAKWNDAAVWFTFGDFAPESSKGFRPDVTLTAHHPHLPFYVRLTLPFSEKTQWKTHLSAAFARFSEAAVSTRSGQSCDIPPQGARLAFQPINPFTLRDVADRFAKMPRSAF